MIRGRRDRRGGPPGERRTSTGRRSGPADEARWWDPGDQAAVEEPVLAAADLGRGWHDVPMVNNAERLDPFGPDEASAAVRAAREARTLTGLDEGRAWRRRRDGALAVVRVEAFGDADERDHRAAWREHAEHALDATWRSRWSERGRTPGWIEARWVDAVGADPDPFADVADELVQGLDWLRVEDHTDHRDDGLVAVYEHVTLWAGRLHATLTIRHDLGTDVPVAPVAAALLARLRARGDDLTR